MKNHFGSKISGLAGLLVAGALAISISGCGKVHNTTTSPDTTSTTTSASADVTASFTTSPGVRMERTVSGLPATLSFDVVGIENEPDNQPIVCFYDAQGYFGGQHGGNGFNGELRATKLKVYGANGKLMGNESKRYGFNWKGSVKNHVELQFNSGDVQLYINGALMEDKFGPVSSTFTLGIGWPTKIRNGFTGSVYTDVHWPTGSTPK